MIEDELLGFVRANREALLDRVAGRLVDGAGGDLQRARQYADADLGEVEHLLINHAEAVG